ncbi:hypothetical protein BX266_6423 [Streptomyces sp. TLI_171]|nr:hypothetical protein BX266_6423 [Streptomyces sp. TLI_171]
MGLGRGVLDPGEPVLGADHDLTYHHALELRFTAPEFVACPTSFQDPVFRTPTPDEERRITRRLDGPPPVLLGFEADAGGVEPAAGLITAGGVRRPAATSSSGVSSSSPGAGRR